MLGEEPTRPRRYRTREPFQRRVTPRFVGCVAVRWPPHGGIAEPAEGEAGVKADPLHQPLPGRDVADRPEAPGRLGYGGGGHHRVLPEATAGDGEPGACGPVRVETRSGNRDGGVEPPTTTCVVVARPV